MVTNRQAQPAVDTLRTQPVDNLSRNTLSLYSLFCLLEIDRNPGVQTRQISEYLGIPLRAARQILDQLEYYGQIRNEYVHLRYVQ